MQEVLELHARSSRADPEEEEDESEGRPHKKQIPAAGGDDRISEEEDESPMRPTLQRRVAIRASVINETVLRMGALNVEDVPTVVQEEAPRAPFFARPRPPRRRAPPSGAEQRDSALQTALAELCCCALPQRAAPPFRASPEEAKALLLDLEAHAAALRAAAAAAAAPAGGVDSLTLPEAQASLATALCDARLCGTELFRTFLGRRRLRGYLGLLRSSGPPGARLVPRPRALPPPPPRGGAERWRAGEGSGAVPGGGAGEPAAGGAGPGGGGAGALGGGAGAAWAEEDVEALAESATAFLEAFTTSAVRMDPHLFDLEEGPALQLATRVGEFAQPFERTGRGTWAKAAYLRALALRLFEHRHEAVHAYYQAWAGLRGAQLVPCPLEARLIPDLADLLFETFRHREAFHVAQAGYELGGDPEAAALSRYRLEMTLSAVRRWKGDAGAAERHAARAVEVAEALGPGYRQLLVQPLFALMILGVHRMSPETTRDRLVRVTGAMVALEEGADGADPDPCLPDLDQPSCLRYSLAFNPPSLLINGSKAYAVAAQHSEGARASVVSAHVFYNLGEYHLLAGDLASATKAFEKCAAVYGGRYAHSFPLEHPRRRRVVEVLAQLRRGEEPASRYAPFAAARATASPEPSPTGSPHSDPSASPPPAPAAGPALPDPALTPPPPHALPRTAARGQPRSRPRRRGRHPRSRPASRRRLRGRAGMQGQQGRREAAGAVVQCVNVQPAQQLLAALWRRPEEPPEPDPRP
eukprot:tig00021591_g22801.t1